MRRGLLVALMLATLFAALAPAATYAAEPRDDRAQAEALHKQGLDLARSGDYKGAIERFRAALNLYPFAVTKHTLGRAYEELGELKVAWEWFRQALQEDYEYAADGRERLSRLDAALRRDHAFLTVRTTPSKVTVVLTLPDGSEETHVSTPFEAWVPAGRVKVVGTNPDFQIGQRDLELVAGEDRTIDLVLQPLLKQGFLMVNGNVPGASIYLGDTLIGKLPMSAAVAHPAGPYEVRVTRTGYAPFRENVVIRADEVTTVSVTLQSLTTEPVAGDPKDAAGDGGGVPSWVGATLIGVGAASVVAGVVFHVRAFDLADEANAIPDDGDPANDRAFDAKWSEAKDNQTYAWIGYGAAIALVGTGTLLLVLAPEEDGPGGPPARDDDDLGFTVIPHVSAVPGYVGGGATLRF